jgi:NADH-quinone oxidoreductase subunit C
MSLALDTIKERLTSKFSESVKDFIEPYGMLTFEVEALKLLEVMQFLKEDETLRFNFLTTLAGVHYPDSELERQFAMVYHMHNWLDNVRIRFKVFISGENPEIDSVTRLFTCANWMEREAYDFYGITFTGHPDLKRILNMDEMVSFPMRKEFPLEDQGRTDKDDRFFGRLPVNSNTFEP